MARAVEEHERGVEVACVISARFDANWYRDHVKTKASKVAIFNSSLNFNRPDGSTQTNQQQNMLVYYGKHADKITEHFTLTLTLTVPKTQKIGTLIKYKI